MAFPCCGNDQQGIYFTINKPFAVPTTSYKVNLRCLGKAMITACWEAKLLVSPIPRSKVANLIAKEGYQVGAK